MQRSPCRVALRWALAKQVSLTPQHLQEVSQAPHTLRGAGVAGWLWGSGWQPHDLSIPGVFLSIAQESSREKVLSLVGVEPRATRAWLDYRVGRPSLAWRPPACLWGWGRSRGPGALSQAHGGNRARISCSLLFTGEPLPHPVCGCPARRGQGAGRCPWGFWPPHALSRHFVSPMRGSSHPS